MALDWLLRPTFLLILILILEFTSTFSLPDSEALIKLKKSFTDHTNALSSWVPGSSPCQNVSPWKGIKCSQGIVTSIRLQNMGLSGKIDCDALSKIPGLRSLNFDHNSFSGPIPEVNHLTLLKSLRLRGNQFSGEIPSDFFVKMVSLKKVWLSDNKFTGKIPSSLAQLPLLRVLHLEDNQFSGSLPVLNQPTLSSFNVSNNHLQGEIPPSLARFTHSFQGNPAICGDGIGDGCLTPTALSDVDGSRGSHIKSNVGKIIVIVVTLFVMLASVALVVILKHKSPSATEGETLGRVRMTTIEVQDSKTDTTMKKQGLGRKTSSNGRTNVSQLVMLNDKKGSFRLFDLMKASAEVLGSGKLGCSYKAVMANGVAVAVKRMRNTNALAREGFEAEMRRLGDLRHENILTPLAFHYRKDEKLLVYEYMPKGSLLYLLHGDRRSTQAELDWPTRLMILRGIAKGLSYISSEVSGLPHGNLKSSNVLISPENEPLLTEFGFSPLINRSIASEALFSYKAPEAAQNGVSTKCDVYCLGIIVLEVLTGKFPSQYDKGGIDVIQWVESTICEGNEAESLDPEIASSTDSLGQMKKLLYIGVACVEKDAEKRLEMEEAINRIQDIKLEDNEGLRPMSLQNNYVSEIQEHKSKKSRSEYESISSSFSDVRDIHGDDHLTFSADEASAEVLSVLNSDNNYIKT